MASASFPGLSRFLKEPQILVLGQEQLRHLDQALRGCTRGTDRGRCPQCPLCQRVPGAAMKNLKQGKANVLAESRAPVWASRGAPGAVFCRDETAAVRLVLLPR